jgi:3-deoxy-D-manno-octulosonate 8-phosphate phosphatase (KDO 8-P phosphatase)
MRLVDAVVLDVDGVLTDGGFWWGPNGEEWKRFCFADVMGVSLGRKAGLVFGLISGEASPLVDRFAEKMQIEAVYKGIKDKGAALHAFSERTGIPLSRVCFAGDDVNDLSAMALAGFSAAPANAQAAVLAAAKIHLAQRGGNGAVRELIELVLAGAPFPETTLCTPHPES